MAYTALYNSSDLSEVLVDLIVGIGAVAVGFVAIIGLFMLIKWFMGDDLNINIKKWKLFR